MCMLRDILKTLVNACCVVTSVSPEKCYPKTQLSEVKDKKKGSTVYSLET